MKKIEVKLVTNGPINFPKPEPTEEDWVIARLIATIHRSSHMTFSTSRDVFFSVRYLADRVGIDQLGKMFQQLRKERDGE